MKRFLTVLLTLSLALSLGACTIQEQAVVSEIETQEEIPEVLEALSGVRIVVDTWGREVEIPENVESIVCLGSGAPRMAAYLQVLDMLVGGEEHDIDNYTVLRDYNPVYHELLKGLPPVGAGGGSGNNNGYPEEIIMAAPDVILAGFSMEAAEELTAQTGIPVVCVRYISTGLANESFYDAMNVFAEVVGAQERCAAVLSYIDACKEDLDLRTAEIADEDKLTVYAGAVTFNGRHGFAGTYANFGPFDAVNALNVSDEVSEDGYFETDLEKVIVWDPDVIFLDPGNMDLVNDEYSTNPEFFNSLRAVNAGEVYTMPSFNNCGMNITYALMDAYYAGIVLFPEEFSDVDIDRKSAEILEMFLGENIYEEMAEGGLYYGKITIGE